MREAHLQNLMELIVYTHSRTTVKKSVIYQIQVGSSSGNGPLLHHLEDLARKELEVSKLRKEKIMLEKSMRDINMVMVEKQQMMQVSNSNY